MPETRTSEQPIAHQCRPSASAVPTDSAIDQSIDSGSAPSDLDARQAALMRLQSSRERLRTCVWPPADDAASGLPQGRHFFGRRARRLWLQWRRRLQSSTAAVLAMDIAQQWWRGQPWAGTVDAVGSGARAVIAPKVRRHPRLAVLLAAAAGAGIVLSRPWRWRSVVEFRRALPGQFGHWLSTQASALPMQAIVSSLMTVLVSSSQDRDPGHG